MRDFEKRCFPKQASLVKTFRIQPMIDNSSLAKYQSSTRSEEQSRLQTHSTPKQFCENNLHSVKPRPSSTKAERSMMLARSAKSLSKMPSFDSAHSCHKTGQSHTRTFNVRSASCTPLHRYMSEQLHTAVKLNKAAPAQSIQQLAFNTSKARKGEDKELPDRFGQPISLPPFVRTNPHLRHNELTMGQKQYLWGIARVYSVSQLKKQKQQQYQALLDHEFKRRLEKIGLNEREKVKEMKDYLRYRKFINSYKQRKPSNFHSGDIPSEVRVADHIRRHTIKGWTTDKHDLSNDKADINCNTEAGQRLQVGRERHPVKIERGVHIYKHVIKGWTMDPLGNDAFNHKHVPDHEKEDNKQLPEPDSRAKHNASIYRVDISSLDNNNHYQGDTMKMTKLKPVKTASENKEISMNTSTQNQNQIEDKEELM